MVDYGSGNFWSFHFSTMISEESEIDQTIETTKSTLAASLPREITKQCLQYLRLHLHFTRLPVSLEGTSHVALMDDVLVLVERKNTIQVFDHGNLVARSETMPFRIQDLRSFERGCKSLLLELRDNHKQYLLEMRFVENHLAFRCLRGDGRRASLLENLIELHDSSIVSMVEDHDNHFQDIMATFCATGH